MTKTRWAPPHLDAIQPYVPGKPLDELARELGVVDAVKLASNECPMPPAPAVLDALCRAAQEVTRYPDGSAFALRQELAAALSVGTDELVFGHGSNEVIDLLCRTLCTPADHAIVGVPSFVAYELCLKAANIPHTRVPLREHLYWDLDALSAAIQPNTRLLFLDNPNNPTSTHVPGEALAGFLRAVPEHVTVVIDEAYCEFADAADYRSGLGLRDTRERLVVLRTFSKAFGLAGLRVGFGVAPAPLVAYLNRVRAPFNVTAPAQAAARAALASQAWLAEYVALNQRERARVSAALSQLGLPVAPSQANFVTVGLARSGREVYQQLLQRGVIVRDLPAPLDRWLRISIGLPEENDRFLSTLADLLG